MKKYQTTGIYITLMVIMLAFFASLLTSKTDTIKDTTYSEFMGMVKNNEVGKLKVVNFEDVSKLKAKGNTLLENIDENNKPMEMEKYKVSQGYLETSNANVIESMINSISGSRTYETLSKVIYSTDSTLRKAVNDVGRVMQ